MLAVSDNVLLENDYDFGTKLNRHVERTFIELAKGALEIIHKLHARSQQEN